MTAKTDKKIKKVLLVDDDEYIQLLVKDIFWLKGEGRYDLCVTDNIKKALEIIFDEKERPDLILLDILLPEEHNSKPIPDGGFGLLKKIKADPRTKHITVIVFSGYTEAALRKKALEIGAAKYLIKTENLPTEIMEAVNSLIK